MRKKLMLMMLVTVMLLSGCGSSEVSNASDTASQSSEVIEDNETPKGVEDVAATATPEPTTTPAPTAEPTPKPTATPDPEVVKFEEGMAKVYKVIDACNSIIENDVMFELILLDDAINLTDNCLYFDVITKDGKELPSNFEGYNIIANYFYNYVNNDTGYYLLHNWTTEQESWESFNIMDEEGSTLKSLMLEAAGISYWLSTCEKIDGINVEENNSYNISGINSSYIINLNCDGIDISAIFDEDGNLLNINTPDDFDHYVSPVDSKEIIDIITQN